MVKSSLLRKLQIEILLNNQSEVVDGFRSIITGCDVVTLEIFDNGGDEIVYYKTVGDKKKFVIYLNVEFNLLFLSYENYYEIARDLLGQCDYEDVCAISAFLLSIELNHSLLPAQGALSHIENDINRRLNLL